MPPERHLPLPSSSMDPTTTNQPENHDRDAAIQELAAMLAARELRIEQLEAELAAQQQQQQVCTAVAQELVERESAARCALDEAEAVGMAQSWLSLVWRSGIGSRGKWMNWRMRWMRREGRCRELRPG